MSDLDVIAAIRPEVPFPTSVELDRARQRLADAIVNKMNVEDTLESSVPSTAVTAVDPHKRRRWGRVALAGAVAAVAAGLTAVVVVPGNSAPNRPSDSPPVIHLAAVQFLDKAAASALDQTASPPLSSQFVYSETEDPDGTITDTWLSADGSSSGLSHWTAGAASPDAGTSGGNDLGPSCSIAQAEATGCTPIIGYYPDLPTDPNAVLPYLNQVGLVDTANNPSYDSLPGWENNVIGKTVSELMASSYLLPAQQAALFKLMAQTPGFQIVPSMTDAIGRTGVGIEWTFEGDAGAVIFDPTTYAYLGTRTWPGPADFNAHYDGDALVKLAVVSSAGALP
jgi:hypothetical protein